MVAIEASSVLRRRPDVRFRVVDGEAVVLRQSVAEVLVFNEIGARILGLADGRAPVSAWVQALLDDYEAEPDTLLADVLAFAAELTEQGLLEPALDAPAAATDAAAGQPAGRAPGAAKTGKTPGAPEAAAVATEAGNPEGLKGAKTLKGTGAP